MHKVATSSPHHGCSRFSPLLARSRAVPYWTCESQASNLSYGLRSHASNSCNKSLASSRPRNSLTSSSAWPSAPFGSFDFNTATRYSMRNSRFAPAGRRSRNAKTRNSRRKNIRARACSAGEAANVAGVKVWYCDMRLAPTWRDGVWSRYTWRRRVSEGSSALTLLLEDAVCGPHGISRLLLAADPRCLV